MKVHEAGQVAIRPGKRCCDICHELNEIHREHDILVVTDNGAENITGFPYGPAHNIIRK